MTLLGKIRSHRYRWLIGFILLGSCGCANRDTTTRFPTQAPPPFSASGEAAMPDPWWTAFDDPALNRQIGQAFDGSFPLAAALQNLRAARAIVRREASDFFPDVNGVAEIESVSVSGLPEVSNYALGLETAYQVDLWGQIESRVDAERFRAMATHADYHAVALALTAEVAVTWFSLIEAQAQLALLDEQIESNQTGLKLQEARFELGQIRSPDVFRQRQLVESTLEQAVVVRSRIEVLEHRLAVLQGRPPQLANYQTGTRLPELPPLPDTGLPSDLLRRRPDVRREYLAFQAADRDLAAAVTDRYPRLNLAGSVVSAAESPEDLFRSWFISIGSQLIGPLIDGGQRRAEIDRTAAVVRQRFNEYGQTVLIAMREVEDALAQERYLIQRIERLEKQVELARQASVQLREQYLIQEVGYLDVLSSITQEQALQRETLSARLQLVLTRVGLYLALAGGFDPSPQGLTVEVAPPTEPPQAEAIRSELPEELMPGEEAVQLNLPEPTIIRADEIDMEPPPETRPDE
jgi:NodT family efflux transporter outer membrane factor (OMF) lipoprotein